MLNRKDLKLGMTVKDPMTGMVGMAVVQSRNVSGCVQISIQPQGDGTNAPDYISVDDFLLEIVDEGISARVPAVDNTVTIKLGEEVEDTITGFKGIVTEERIHLNGCVHFAIQAKMKDNDITSMSLDHKRLKRKSAGVVKEAEKVPVGRTGGPMRRGSLFR